MKIAIIGTGVLGTALGVLLQRAEHEIVALSSRTVKSARVAAKAMGFAPVVGDPGLAALGADVVILAVPDRTIPAVSIQVAAGGALRRGAVVTHLSGALPSGVLAGVTAAGGLPASMHPLQAFASVDTALTTLPGSYVFLEGSAAATEILRRLVLSIEAKPIPLDATSKALYHAAACVASNYLVTLVDIATQLMRQAGVPTEIALPAVLPLVRGTLRNLERDGLPDALTGPIARGDVGTVRTHLEVLGKVSAPLRAAYVTMARATLEVALRKGKVAKAAAEQLRALLDGTG